MLTTWTYFGSVLAVVAPPELLFWKWLHPDLPVFWILFEGAWGLLVLLLALIIRDGIRERSRARRMAGRQS